MEQKEIRGAYKLINTKNIVLDGEGCAWLGH